jgi:hypothetical protein
MMLFDGAFVVPSWLRQLAIQPVDLITHCRREEGAPAASVSAGALGLAEWLLADAVRAEREARTPGSPLSMGGVITRLLAGTAVPGDEQAAAIERMTDGDVAWSAWSRVALDGAPGDAPEREPEPEPVLGETASGPLWQARSKGRVIEVDGGFGIVMRMSRAAGAQLHSTLGAILTPPGGTPPGSIAHL